MNGDLATRYGHAIEERAPSCDSDCAIKAHIRVNLAPFARDQRTAGSGTFFLEIAAASRP
jgi:hypothetical protein